MSTGTAPAPGVPGLPGSEVPPPFPQVRVKVPTVLQMEETECGAASLGMVLAHAGRVVPLEELREACGVSRDGSNASMMLKAARSYGMEAKGYRRPYAKLAEGELLPQILFWRYSHWVVLEGYGKGGVYINDPAEGRLTVTTDDAERLYSGVALYASPGRTSSAAASGGPGRPTWRHGSGRPGSASCWPPWPVCSWSCPA